MVKEKGMKCICGKVAGYKKGLRFNGFSVDGWVCRKCGEIYYHPEQIQKILLMKKLEKQKMIIKLGQIRSNLILRIPKDVGDAFDLKKGEQVAIKIEGKGIKVTKT